MSARPTCYTHNAETFPFCKGEKDPAIKPITNCKACIMFKDTYNFIQNCKIPKDFLLVYEIPAHGPPFNDVKTERFESHEEMKNFITAGRNKYFYFIVIEALSTENCIDYREEFPNE